MSSAFAFKDLLTEDKIRKLLTEPGIRAVRLMSRAIAGIGTTEMDITYYVALPFLQDEAGSPVAGAAEECQTSSGALRRAEILSKAAGSIGAVAFSRTGDPSIGEFGDARLLKKFGNVPDDLSGL